MSRVLFGLMYRLGFTPWEGHPLPEALRRAAERPEKGRALDVGCGTGDTSILLARAGWDVTGVDFVERALERARKKAGAAGVDVRFVRADATRLAEAGIGKEFALIVDNGCFHGLSDDDREAYVRGIDAVAAPGALFVLTAFAPSEGKRPPRGVEPEEVRRRFAAGWEIREEPPEPGLAAAPGRIAHVYELRRKATTAGSGAAATPAAGG